MVLAHPQKPLLRTFPWFCGSSLSARYKSLATSELQSKTFEQGNGVVLLKIREAAKRLGVHENTIRNWCNEGRISFIYLPGDSGYRRIPEEEVERMRDVMNSMDSNQLRLW